MSARIIKAIYWFKAKRMMQVNFVRHYCQERKKTERSSVVLIWLVVGSGAKKKARTGNGGVEACTNTYPLVLGAKNGQENGVKLAGTSIKLRQFRLSNVTSRTLICHKL
jgi:hypothetical protein